MLLVLNTFNILIGLNWKIDSFLFSLLNWKLENSSIWPIRALTIWGWIFLRYYMIFQISICRMINNLEYLTVALLSHHIIDIENKHFPSILHLLQSFYNRLGLECFVYAMLFLWIYGKVTATFTITLIIQFGNYY